MYLVRRAINNGLTVTDTFKSAEEAGRFAEMAVASGVWDSVTVWKQ